MKSRRYCKNQLNTTFCEELLDFPDKTHTNSISHHLSDTIKEHLKNKLNIKLGNNSSSLNDTISYTVLTPVIVDLSTKPNTKEVPNNVREQAILTEASIKYKKYGKEFTENYLK